MNSDLQQKLQQFSAEPPEGVWNKIAGALDEEGSFAGRLYQYEEPPPAGSWAAVESSLAKEPKTETTETPVVPITKRFSTPLRYAAVASVVAAALVIFTLTSDRTEAGAIDPKSNTTVPTRSAPVTAGQPARTDGFTADAPANRSAANTDRSLDGPDASGTRTAPYSAGKSGSDQITSSLNEYVTYSDDDGNVMKVSKKMANYLLCKDDDLPCKKRLKELQQRMAASAMTTDFTGVLDMLRQLQ